MELTSLLNSVSVVQVIGEVQRKDVAAIVYDSRKVITNSVFVAIKGLNTDGHKYILEAINNGAIAVVIENNSAVPDEVFIHRVTAKILVKNSRKALAELSNAFYKEPSKKIKLIGITGTNGKTTTTYFLKSIFETAGEKVGLIGTIANFIGDTELKSLLTTPESNDLNALLLDMHSQGCSYAVMEVSSHSLVLDRVYKLNFGAGIFTNLTSDHLDFHQTFENYRDAKKILFDSLSRGSFCISNSDDTNAAYLTKDTQAKKYSFGTTDISDFRITNIQFDLNGTRFDIHHNGELFSLKTSLVGGFNAYNASAAFCTSVLFNFDSATAIKGIADAKQVPGRFEILGKGQKKVIVDYSHTADSLEKTLQAILKIVKDDRQVITVFGCGGNRDRSKRPLMGRIASEYSSLAVITSDNPRNEDPFDIIKEIQSGISKTNFKVIENREEAISYAIKNSPDDAVILVAGKGHENYQEIKGVRHHFSDKEVAEKNLSS